MSQTEAPAQPDEVTEPLDHQDEEHNDPLHDIDGPKTTYAVVGTLVLVVGLIWAMSHVFSEMVRVERQEKIGNIPTTELDSVRAGQMAELQGENPNRGTKTIDQAIAEYLKK